MIHLSLNTGHSMTVPPAKVGAAAIRALSPMVVRKGDLIPGFAPWRTVIAREPGHASFDIRRNKHDSVVLNVVAWTREGAEKGWEGIEKHYLDTADQLAARGIALDLEMPSMPDSLPWLVTWILPQADQLVSHTDIHWMADFEQCLAATIIHKSSHE